MGSHLEGSGFDIDGVVDGGLSVSRIGWPISWGETVKKALVLVACLAVLAGCSGPSARSSNPDAATAGGPVTAVSATATIPAVLPPTAPPANPAGSGPVVPGATVTVTVDGASTQQVVPSGLVGNNVYRVHQQLNEAGFGNVSEQQAAWEPPSASANEVLRVDPAEGVQIAAGQLITLYYASGAAEVPAIEGYDKDVALKRCTDAGFFNVVLKERASTAARNTVIGTDPAPGTLMGKRDRLAIYYAVPPQTVVVTTTSTTTSPPRITTTTSTTTSSPRTPTTTSSPRPSTTPTVTTPPPGISTTRSLPLGPTSTP